ncbi:MAG: arginine--tRNA ligase [Candidatus Ratteibacteria bacterium]|nr:arginine--tRNA ligase [Candidatus Ratteibacteria bacterium]
MEPREEIINQLKELTNLKEINLETPKGNFGDYAFPCFALSKTSKKNPAQIAKDLESKIKVTNIIEKVQAVGPYLNFFLNRKVIAETILKKIAKEKNKFGSGKHTKAGHHVGYPTAEKILVEHTSINPNASPHIGRARNALLGDFIVRLLKFQGYEVQTHYFVNDIGKQIAMLVLAAEGRENITFNDLLTLYIKINEKIEKEPELEKDVFELLNKLERGDEKTKKRFADIVDICVKGQLEILSELNIKYDKFDFESDYLWTKKTERVLEELKKTGRLFLDDEQRYVLDQKEFNLPMESPVLVLTRADKTSLYPLRDLAYHIDKKKTKNILVLGEDQKLYFQQLKCALTLLNKPVPIPVFYSFVLLETGKMSTRKGNLVLLEDFMREALQRETEEIRTRHDRINEEDAKKIAYGAIKYSILKVSPERNVIFSWKALQFEGDTGPYLQYACARINSILRKYDEKIDEKIDFSLFKTNEENNLIKMLADFEGIIEESERTLKPTIIVNYIYSLAQSFSNFYIKCPILKAEEKLKKARLLLASSVKQVIETGLNILGIETLEKM